MSILFRLTLNTGVSLPLTFLKPLPLVQWTQIGRSASALQYRLLTSVLGSLNMDNPKVGKGSRSRLDNPVVLKHIKYKMKSQGKMSAPSNIEITVVGTGKGCTPRSFMIHMDHFNYLFNCGEGVQRIAAEHKMKISRLDNIFITHRSWDNIGGMLGMCLSLEGVNVPEIRIHGPPKTESFVMMTRGFGQLHKLKIDKKEFDGGVFEDSATKIAYVPIYSELTTEVAENKDTAIKEEMDKGAKEDRKDGYEKDRDNVTNEDKFSEESPNIYVALDAEEPIPQRSAKQANKECRKFSEREEQMALAFIVKPIPKARSVDLEKCVNLGITLGPIVGKLKDGNMVTLEDGRVIQPDDVLAPEVQNKPILVIECPTSAYLKSMVENEELSKLTAAGNSDEQAEIVIHLSPPDVLDHPVYSTWMDSFPEETRHLIINETGSGIVHLKMFKYQTCLNQIHQGIFPLLPCQIDKSLNEVKGICKENVVYGETGLSYAYRTNSKSESHIFSREQCISIENGKYLDELYAQEDFKPALDKIKVKLSAENDPGEVSYPEIIFLGTGSSLPSTARNVSGIWVNLSEDQSMLLDCGENTTGQIHRHFGKETKEMLRRLTAIFVSHLHADHHLGIPGLLGERHKLHGSLEPITIIAPAKFKDWYKGFDTNVLPISQLVRFIQMENLYPSNREDYDDYQVVTDLLQCSDVHPVRVIHRQYPHAIILKHQSGWSLAYSGDTMPCRDFIFAGQDVDILIHEATMEDDLEDQAAKKRHSTTSQAINVGEQMKAGFTLLTHFSQRYAKIPVLHDDYPKNIGIAFDNMRVHRGNLHLLPHFIPALKAMFAEEHEALMERGQKRKYKAMQESVDAKAKQTKQSKQSKKGTAQLKKTVNSDMKSDDCGGQTKGMPQKSNVSS